MSFHLCTSHLYLLLPHLRGWMGIMIFTFQSPGISPALWGQADGNNPALCPTLHNRKSQQGKCPIVITPTLPPHFGDNQKVIVRHASMTHTLRLLCKFSRADDAVYPSSFKAACSGLSVPSKLAVVLFSGHSGFFPQGKNRLRPLRWHDLFVSSVRFGNSH